MNRNSLVILFLVFETLKEFALICQMTIILLEKGAPDVVLLEESRAY
jgi:hypothetical protein